MGFAPLGIKNSLPSHTAFPRHAPIPGKVRFNVDWVRRKGIKNYSVVSGDRIGNVESYIPERMSALRVFPLALCTSF